MKKIRRAVWGYLPLILFIICTFCVAIIQKTFNITLRVIPCYLMQIMGMGSFGMFLFWLNRKVDKLMVKSENDKVKSLLGIMKAFFKPFFLMVLTASLLSIGIFHQPEYDISRYDMKMVACVKSFLDQEVYYYEYINALFYGEKLGYEYFGSSGSDPMLQIPKPQPIRWIFYDVEGNVIDSGSSQKSIMNDPQEDQMQVENNELEAEMKKLSIEVMTHRENELVFSVSINDLIDSYNGYYWQEHKKSYLNPISCWRLQIEDCGIHSPHKTFQYNFTENAEIWSLPTINVYVPSDGDYIQEVALSFDDHSYNPAMYQKYEEICFYTLKVFFPDLTDEQITKLYTTINEMAYENILPNDQGYHHQVVPYVLFYKNGISVYPYFAIGECLHLCIMPVTSETLTQYEKEGIKIYEI